MKRRRSDLAAGLLFLSPNIVGVLVFTVFPVFFSLMMAFTNWDITLHNKYKEDGNLEFVGLGNFIEMFSVGDAFSWDAKFLIYLGNTLFFMMGIPFAVMGSLTFAMLLSKDPRGGGGRVLAWLLGSLGLASSCVVLVAIGMGWSAMVVMLLSVLSVLLIGGPIFGNTFYRTIFYTPSFVAGVATFLVWKKMYSRETGPVNRGLEPVLDGLAVVVQGLPGVVVQSLLFVGYGLVALLLGWGLGRMRRSYLDGELDGRAAVLPVGVCLVPVVVASQWSMTAATWWVLAVMVVLVGLYQLKRLGSEARFPSRPWSGFDAALVIGLVSLVGQFVVLGLAVVAFHLPGMAEDGLAPPSWLNDPDYAKPALMITALWAAVGSNNMLLYLAALTNVPEELYEAADIDGASRFQRFWGVTWPQLAPTTFFIVVISTIAGLQGGFEMARVMTNGGPAGATTTLEMHVYLEGFVTGRLGLASAVSWVLFLLVFGVTLFNWKFGNRYVND
ncbi:carbohydrate ABC transporter permease [Mucisphaera sp.]|uniref:carbohydrate ABC transporter permease n=1 Tax=Mucisphaera sp. TaxID=2913024 RepID=UPI003D0F8DE4